MESAASKNSTIVRDKKKSVPPWFRTGFRLMGAVVPDVAASVGWRIFFTPRHSRLREQEQAVLARGERFSFDVDGEKVVARIWGRGPTVLLAHGWGGHSGQMTPLVDPLVAAGYRVVAIDFPGHGESGRGLSSVVHFSRTVERAPIFFGPIHSVIAHSMGASATMLAMTRGFQVSRVAFFAPHTSFDTTWAQIRAEVGVSDVVWQKLGEKVVRWVHVSFDDVRLLEHLEMSTPLLVLHDAADREVPFEEGQGMARRWPNASLFRTEELGHTRILKDPGAVAAAVKFVSEGA